MKTCQKRGVLVKDDAVLFCPEGGTGVSKELPQTQPNAEAYYEDVLPEDAGREEPKKNNTGLFVKIAFVGFAVAIIVSACAVVAFML